jgi:isopentenyldiphosphate isomerase
VKNDMETWDVYDKYRRKTGATHERGFNMKEGDYHIVVHVWIVNSKGEFLIQKRQHDKKGWAGMWDCAAAGSAILGDSSMDAAIRETKEEIGLDIKSEELEPLFTVKFSRGFDDNWLVRKNVNLEDLVLQQEEVADVKWATMDEINQMVEDSEFIPFPFLDRLYEIINSSIRLQNATIEDKGELLELQRIVFMPLYLKYEDHDFSPATQTMERFSKRFEIGNYYKILFDDSLVGSIFVFEKSPGIMKFHIINILEEFQGKGIAKEIMKRIETLYPEAERWELETIITETKNCSLYEKMGYIQTGESRKINDKLTLISYVKDKDIYRIEDIKMQQK